jgi:O-antigen biosynthesis protein
VANSDNADLTPEKRGAEHGVVLAPRQQLAHAGSKPLARFIRLAHAARVVLRRHGPVVLSRHTLLWLGGKRGYVLRDLLMDVPDFRAVADSAPEMLALCISGVGLDAMRYRCEHLAEQFELQGYRADVATADQVRLTDAIARYAVFVLHRVMAAPDYAAFVVEARRRGKVVIFDTDDLAFDVSLLNHVPGIGEFSSIERKYAADIIERNSQMMRACDAVIVSTEYLRDYILRTGVHQRVFLVPNVASAAMVHGADIAITTTAHTTASAASVSGQVSRKVSQQAEAPVTIGYFSGTKTHNRDFLEAADALLWTLEHYTHVRLQVVGQLRLDSRFDRYAERVLRMPLQPWQRLPHLYTAVDINIAPLERDNPFTEAKSCIKYLEAALCKVPSIASPRSDFRRVIVPGVTGLLANTPAEWQAALAHLIESPVERRTMGERAYAEVRSRETTSARAASTCAVFRSLAPAALAPEHVAY